MIINKVTKKLLISTTAFTLCSLPAWADHVTPDPDVTSYFPTAIAGLVGIAVGAFLFSQQSKSLPSSSKRYLAAIERISQVFTSNLRDKTHQSPKEAIEWIMRETAHTMDCDRVSLWLYDNNQFSLGLKYSFDEDNCENTPSLKIDRAGYRSFFSRIRAQRTVPFADMQEEEATRELTFLFEDHERPKSMLVAQIGSGNKAVGILNIVSKKMQRQWSDSDRQFAGSIADLIAFYLANHDLQNAEDALLTNEKRFRDLVDASSDWYWETGPDHKLTYLSDQFSLLTGIPQQELIGKTRHDFSNLSKIPTKWVNHWHDLEAHRPFRDYVYTLPFKGRTLFIAINGKPFFDDEGTFLGYRGTGADITETTTFKSRFDEGINALSTGFVMWDAQDQLVLWNEKAIEFFPSITKYLTKPLTYRDLLDYCEQENAIKYPTPLNEEIRDKLVQQHRECGTRELELSNGMYVLVQEHPTSEGGIVGIYTDITTLKQRENELIESNLFSETLSQCGNMLIHARNESFILSESCRIIKEVAHFDAAWITTFEESSRLPEYLNLSAHSGIEIAHPTFKPTRPIKTAFIKQKLQTIHRNFSKETFPDLSKESFETGCIIPIRGDRGLVGFLNVASNQQVAFGDSHINLLIEVANDISYGLSSLKNENSRLIAEEALRESEGRYRSLIDMSPDAILVLNNQEEIVFANPAGHALFKSANRQELLGTKFSDFLITDENIFQSEDTSESHTISSIELNRLDQTSFEADITSRPVTYGGQETRLLILRDVTERNRVNDHLAQTSKLATLGEMAAGITHELSQPLNIMRFAAEGALLKINRQTITEEKIKDQFNLISLQSGRMADIIDHMRIFSRKDTGSIEIFDPSLVIRQSIDMVEAQFLAENIIVEARYPAYYNKIKGRPIQLEQVILNLINNARDAIINNNKTHDQKDRALANMINIAMTYDQSENEINIAVTDTGGGIAHDNIKRLFDPFFTTKEVGKGTGLGLSVSYGIISAMGGDISVRNIHNGARFDVCIPCEEEDADSFLFTPKSDVVEIDVPIQLPNEDDDFDLELDPNAPHVLIVDDEIYAAEGMMEYVYSFGYRASIAGNGEEALEVHKEDPADIVITDVRMPKMDGHTLIRHLKKTDPDLPIIVVTGHTGMEDNDQEFLNTQTNQIMKKPVSLSELVQHLDKLKDQLKLTKINL